jgi:uncharacterized protein (TIGR02301 family)
MFMVRRRFFISAGLLALCGLLAFAAPALAVDPPYEGQMEQLTGLMGSLYFLEPLCGQSSVDWRAQAAGLIDADKPDDDRRHRLNGAFNDGYDSYARLYNRCTPSAQEAMQRLMSQAGSLARDIHSHYAQ